MNKCLRIALIMFTVFMFSGFYPADFSHYEINLGGVCFANSSPMSQSTGTSQGTVKRHIDISSPWSGGYLYEELTVVGSAEITESFTMGKPGPGLKDFFGDNFIKNDAMDKVGSDAGKNPKGDKGSNTYSGQKGISASVSQAKSDSKAGKVLGTSIIAIPTWFDLF